MNRLLRIVSLLIGFGHLAFAICRPSLGELDLNNGQTLIPHVALLITSVLYIFVTAHAQIWIPLAKKFEGDERDFMPEPLFHVFMWLFLLSMTMVCIAHNLGFLWVAVELTTLMSAPLIVFHRSAGSLEAMWKYLLICSVGIGLALFGTMFIAHAAHIGGVKETLDIAALAEHRNSFDPTWFKIGFVLILAGYGTKMGLAPFHTWLPDAHSEAPAPASAMLSGSLLNCSLVAILAVCRLIPDSLLAYCTNLMMCLGFLSVAVAAIFIVRQTDYKRMLAYSSVEHMGIIAILCALGLKERGSTYIEAGMAIAIAHMVFHSLTKMTLFLTAGNLLLAFGTRSIAAVQGLGRSMPGHAVLWALGILMICGMPPSVLFLTELGLVAKASLWVSATVLVLLFIVFAGMSKIMLSMIFSDHDKVHTTRNALPFTAGLTPWCAILLNIALGIAATFFVIHFATFRG